MRLSVQVKPRARSTHVVTASAEQVVIALAAAPVDGAANEELVRFLAECLGLPKRAVAVVRGHTARHKQIQIDAEPGVDLAALVARLVARAQGG